MNNQCAEENVEFQEGTHDNESDHHQVQTTTPLKAACPSYPPLLCTCPLMRSLTSFGFYSSNFCSKEYTLSDVGFSGLEEKDPLCLVFGSFQRKCLPSFCVCLCVCLFVLSSTCLTVRTKRIVELMNVLCCYYLLACACMDLLFLCLGEKGTEGQKPWFKKRKRLAQYCIPCNLCNCWL